MTHKLNHSLTQPCRRCNGTGQELLSRNYNCVITTMKELRKATCAQIYQRMKADGSISKYLKRSTGLVRVHKCVARLEDAGLIRRARRVVLGEDRRTRAWEYEVV